MVRVPVLLVDKLMSVSGQVNVCLSISFLAELSVYLDLKADCTVIQLPV